MAKTRVLIVEDNIDEASYFRDALTRLDDVVSGGVLWGVSSGSS